MSASTGTATGSTSVAVVGGVGAAALGAAIGFYVKEHKVTPLVAASGIAGTVLIIAGLTRKSIQRGSKTCDLGKQTKFKAGTSKWVDCTDEDGQHVKVYVGEKGTLALPSRGDVNELVRDEEGLLVSHSPKVRTTYDLIFGADNIDARPALGWCTQHHTFKDALLKDGTTNPKPSVVDIPGKWELLTFAEMKLQARAFGTCLRRVHNIRHREKVAIWAGNSVEWMLTDLACAAYNLTSVSVYDTLGPDAASYIVADSGAQVLACDDKTFKRVPGLLEDEVYAKNPGADLKVIVFFGKGDAYTKAALEKKGLAVFGIHNAIKEHVNSLEKDTPPKESDIATIMYTSGTTGMPKGVVLKHENLVSTIAGMIVSPSVDLHPTDIHLSYLPLAHIFERQNVLGLLSMGAVVYFASSGTKTLLADLSVVRPTIFAGVPKVYENVRDAVYRKMTGFKKKIFNAAFNAKVADLETGCGYNFIWDILVFNATKKALGGRVRFCVTGGAPISKETLQFVVCALGPVVQGYGCTETSAASTLTMSFDLTVGHVGAPFGNSAIRLVDVPDMNYYSGPVENYTDTKAKTAFGQGKNKNGGEVWIGGAGVSPGYYDPSVQGCKVGIPSNGMAKKTTEDFFMADGWSWFKTGDIGTWTPQGTLKIIDRKKNMFKTTLGEYVPVEEVEKSYQDSCGFIDFVFLPKETKVSYIAVCVVVSDSINVVMQWAKENNVVGDKHAVVSSDAFRKHLHDQFQRIAKDKKMQRFMWIQNAHNIYAEYQALGYQEDWVAGVVCANGHKEQLLTATFKARRAQLDQYFAPAFPKLYHDRPSDHILP